MKLHFAPYTLQISEAFGTAHGTRSETAITLLGLEENGIVGYGEASVPPYYQENQQTQRRFFEQVDLEQLRRLDLIGALRYLDALAPENHAAKTALDLALHDLRAKQQGIPIRRLYQLPSLEKIPTSYTIGLDRLEKMLDKVAAAASFQFLKIKLNGQQDLQTVEAIARQTSQPLLVDANQAWQTLEEATVKAVRLAELGVQLIEQPFPKAASELSRQLCAESPIPIFADEAVQRLSDLASLASSYDGINIKLMKCTGLYEALQMIREARRLGLGVMLGCMTETSIGISAAAQLASLADWYDLDGHLLIDNDPCLGWSCVDGQLRANVLPGLGLQDDTLLRQILKL